MTEEPVRSVTAQKLVVSPAAAERVEVSGADKPVTPGGAAVRADPGQRQIRRWRGTEAEHPAAQRGEPLLLSRPPSQIHALTGIHGEVVELFLLRAIGHVEIAGSSDRAVAGDRPVRAGLSTLDEEVPPPGWRSPLDERAEAPAVGRPRRLSVRRDGRREIDVEGQPRLDSRCRGGSVVPNHQRDANRLLVGRLLPAEAMLSPEKAVVRREDDERVLEGSGVLESRKDSGDSLVDREQALKLPPPESVELLRGVQTRGRPEATTACR